jgi:hypothetical protein
MDVRKSARAAVPPRHPQSQYRLEKRESMKIRRALYGAASVATMTAGFVLFGGAPAQADDGLGGLVGKDGLVPVDLRLGDGGGDGGGSTASKPRKSRTTAGTRDRTRAGLGTSGHRVDVPVPAPVTVCGIEVPIGGKAEGDCPDKGESAAGTPTTLPGNKGGLLSDNQVNVPVTVPVTACGNAVAVLGDARASCDGRQGQSAGASNAQPAAEPGPSGPLAGNEVNVSADAPLEVCGNAVGLAGEADDSCGGSGGPGSPEQPPGDGPGGGDDGPGSGSDSSGSSGLAGADADAEADGELPFTGMPLDTLLGAAAGFLLVGTGAMRLSRRRRTN